MTKEVQQTIETADILLGAERMIADYSARIEKKPYYMAAQILPYLEKLQESEELAQQETTSGRRFCFPEIPDSTADAENCMWNYRKRLQQDN